MADQSVIDRQVVALLNSFSRRIQPGALLPFRHSLADFDNEDVVEATREASRECRYPPSPAELRQYAEDARRRRRPRREPRREFVRTSPFDDDTYRGLGSYRAVTGVLGRLRDWFDDESTKRVIESVDDVPDILSNVAEALYIWSVYDEEAGKGRDIRRKDIIDGMVGRASRSIVSGWITANAAQRSME